MHAGTVTDPENRSDTKTLTVISRMTLSRCACGRGRGKSFTATRRCFARSAQSQVSAAAPRPSSLMAWCMDCAAAAWHGLSRALQASHPASGMSYSAGADGRCPGHRCPSKRLETYLQVLRGRLGPILLRSSRMRLRLLVLDGLVVFGAGAVAIAHSCLQLFQCPSFVETSGTHSPHAWTSPHHLALVSRCFLETWQSKMVSWCRCK